MTEKQFGPKFWCPICMYGGEKCCRGGAKYHLKSPNEIPDGYECPFWRAAAGVAIKPLWIERAEIEKQEHAEKRQQYKIDEMNRLTGRTDAELGDAIWERFSGLDDRTGPAYILVKSNRRDADRVLAGHRKPQPKNIKQCVQCGEWFEHMAWCCNATYCQVCRPRKPTRRG